jgi:hypothetical protein
MTRKRGDRFSEEIVPPKSRAIAAHLAKPDPAL